MMDDDATGGFGEPEGSALAQPTPRMLAWARNSAAYRLARRMMSRQELAQAVSRKARQKYEDITPEAVDRLAQEAVRFGETMGAIDDEAYADIKSQSASRSGKSRRAIAQTLARKGIEKELVTAALEDIDDLAAAVRFARKRGYGPFRRKEADQRQITRELSSLARNGFGFALAQRVVGMEREEAEDLLLPSA
ncbi:regulatory protein RecX [Rhizobium sp.]|jgi:regulatory protein|uniref:regulatory protein RecX n=1 Tax=Rhizobium sp. TaxID=391 RepID=UPI002AA81DF0